MNELANQDPQWVYHIEYIKTSLSDPKIRDYLAKVYPGKDFPPYAAQAAIMRLDELSKLGWELVQMQPVRLGDNGDVQVGSGGSFWTNVYFCVFKRLKRSAQS